MGLRTAVRTASVIVIAAASAGVVSGAVGAAVFIAIKIIKKKIVIEIINGGNNCKINFIGFYSSISIFNFLIFIFLSFKV